MASTPHDKKGEINMIAVIKFESAEKSVEFGNMAGWCLSHPLNSNVTGCDFNAGDKQDRALYNYLLKIGAFEEVELK